jgi:hypothetical protein
MICWIVLVLAHWNNVCRYTYRSTRVHYPDSKPSLKQPSVGIHIAPLGYISWFQALTETTVCRYTYSSTRVYYPDSKPSLKQPSVGIHIAPLGYIILIPSQQVFVLSPKYSVRCGEATNTNFIVVGLTRLGFEPTIYPRRRR